MKSLRKPSYHHGNLRQALIEAAARRADRDGVQGLSLRRIAADVKVSHAASYHHFRNKSELIAAIAEEGFRRMGEHMEEALAGLADAPARERMRVLGRTYIRFAVEQPHYFRIMFRPELFKRGPAPADQPPDPSFLLLVEAVQEHLGEAGAPSERVFDLALFAWSTVHGMAALWLDGSFADSPPYVRLKLDELADRVMDLFERCL